MGDGRKLIWDQESLGKEIPGSEPPPGEAPEEAPVCPPPDVWADEAADAAPEAELAPAPFCARLLTACSSKRFDRSAKVRNLDARQFFMALSHTSRAYFVYRSMP